MKTALSIIVCVILNNFCYSQIDYSKQWANSGWEYSSDDDSILDVSSKIFNNNDLTYLLKSEYPYHSQGKEIPIYGLLGEDFEKIEFVFTEIKKNDKEGSHYIVKGKTKLKSIINDFKGEITFENATAYSQKNTEEPTTVVLIGSYKLIENSTKKNSGTYIGKIKIILSTKNIYANDILFDTNFSYEEGAVRGFVGVRKNNQNGISQSCIWGFTRFPYQYAKGFDIGDGEEVINIKYAKPWFDYSAQKWDSIINGVNKDFYVHQTDKDKGIHTANIEYIEPEEATWFKLGSIDLENTVIKQLKLNPNKIAKALIVHKELPNNVNETVIVIPEIVEEGEQYFELNSYIVIVNSVTGKIIHQYFESSKTNNWVSDAIKLVEITIDTAPYNVTTGIRAFGIRVRYVGSSQANPYENETISLFIKSENTLKNILKSYDVMNSWGEWDTNCAGEFIDENKVLIISENMTNTYVDILVKSKIIESKSYIDKNGDCDSTEKTTTEKTLLKFNGKEYKENNLSIQKLMLLTKLEAIKKYGTPASIEQFILDDAQGEFRNGISDKYTQKERQSESILIDEVTWEKDKNTWITVWYEVKQGKSVPKDVYVWEKGTEF